jgi:hypothetical protein
MVTRYVFIKLNDDHSHAEGREQAAQAIRQALDQVPQVQAARVGICADDHTARGWDLGLQITLKSIEDVPGYLSHPAHRQVVDGYLKPRIACLKAWNFTP